MLSILKLMHTTTRPVRFGEIRDTLGLNTKTLSTRLKELEKANLINRMSYDTIPPRVEYELTDQGKDMEEIFKKLEEFEVKHVIPTPEVIPQNPIID